MRKYEFTGETITANGVTLHQIRALIDIPCYDIHAGDVGGWIENEYNLSNFGDAWVGGDARVCGDAWVGGDARVFSGACVSDNARVFGGACVSGNARVFGGACVSGNAHVFGDARVSGDACVSGNAHVCGDVWVFGYAHIRSASDMLTIGPIGSRDDYTTFFRAKDGVIFAKCGCFLGTLDDFLAAVQKTHGGNKFAKEYRAAAELARIHILGGN